MFSLGEAAFSLCSFFCGLLYVGSSAIVSSGRQSLEQVINSNSFSILMPL